MPAYEILSYSPVRDKGNPKRLFSRKYQEDTPPSLPSLSQLWGLLFPDPLLAVGDLGLNFKSLSIAVVWVGRSWTIPAPSCLSHPILMNDCWF